MKKYLYILVFIPFILTSCEKDIIPTASFSPSRIDAKIGDVVTFNNNSYNARTCEWDFGDGTITNLYNPIHVYSYDGTYTVKLTVWSSTGQIDTYYSTITVLSTTIVDIQVLEYYDEYPVYDASVILYTSYSDWLNIENPYIEGFTDYNGIIAFSNMPSITYYVDVWEENHNNYILAEEDIAYIELPAPVPNQINYYTAWVDYVPGGKKGSKGNYKINKIERRKFEDKPKRVIEK